MPTISRATWSAQYINDLPDSAFACIDDGGEPDEDGKTVPRELRHYPHHDANGDLDLPHLNAAWSRVNQDATTSCGRDHLAAHRKAEGLDEESKSAPRDDLIRMVELPAARMEFRAAANGDGHLGTLTGYAAVFNNDTVIDSWEGRFVERIAPGAFAKTLKERGDRIKVLFNHGFDPSIGDKPLGKPRSMREDDTGLHVEVPLDDTSYNRDIVASLRSGALDGQSFRFSVTRETWDDDDDTELPTRTLNEVKLYEFGPVTFPAYEATTAGVRARPAYEAWRTAHPASGAGPATPEPRDDAADSGTSSPVTAPSVKDRAQAIAAARAVAT